MPYEYMWGLSMEQRGTTDVTIYTAFIHMKTSITAYITSQHMVEQPFISRHSLWRELTTISIIIVLLFYGILYRNSATNLEFRLLYDMQGLPCSIYKVSTIMPTNSVICGGANQLKAWHLRSCH